MDYERIKSCLTSIVIVIIILITMRLYYFISDCIYPPKHKIEKYKKVKISLPKNLKADLDLLAKNKGISTGELITSIIEKKFIATPFTAKERKEIDKVIKKQGINEEELIASLIRGTETDKSVSDYFRYSEHTDEEYETVKILLPKKLKLNLDRTSKGQRVSIEELIVSIIENRATAITATEEEAKKFAEKANEQGMSTQELIVSIIENMAK